MRILTENLESALLIASQSLKNRDGYKCGLVRGWEQILEAIKRGEHIEVADEPFVELKPYVSILDFRIPHSLFGPEV